MPLFQLIKYVTCFNHNVTRFRFYRIPGKPSLKPSTYTELIQMPLVNMSVYKLMHITAINGSVFITNSSMFYTERSF